MEPKLEPPGAGLPFFQGLFLKYFLGPYFSRKTSWEEDLYRFEREGKNILNLCEGLSEEQLNRRILVAPIPGIEDSSRYWSIAMTLDHLMIVGRLMQKAVVSLSEGIVPEGKASVAAVKPAAGFREENLLSRFEEFVRENGKSTLAQVKDRQSKARFYHPWFGPITAKQWFWLMAVHQRIHRKQVQAIRSQL